MTNTTAPAPTADHYVDYLLFCHAHAYSLHPAMATVRQLVGDNGPLLIDINDRLNRALDAKATGWNANLGHSRINPLTAGYVAPRISRF